jgi:hypothetical protein
MVARMWLLMAAVLAARLLAGCTKDGGCTASPVTVTPPESCLHLTAESGPESCTQSILDVWNSCSDTLSLPPALDGVPRQIPPNRGLTYGINRANITDGSADSSTVTFSIPATLGSVSVTIQFASQRETGPWRLAIGSN